jgi:V/A-type H+-transporting ATPase subunit E
MEQKLQSLLEKIQQEGVEKGQEVANSLINDAEQKAQDIVAAAERRAEEIRKQAQQEAEELKRNVNSELKLSAEQMVEDLQQRITGLVTAKATEGPTQAAFQDKDFLKGIIQSLVEQWQKGGQGAALHLSPDREKELYEYFSARAQEQLKEGLTVKPGSKLSEGFRIGPADGSYVVSFTEADFQAFFADFLRPRTKELLYNEKA